MVTISTTELYQILAVTPASQNLMLVGRHGIGKSEILNAYFTSRGMRVVTLFLGQMSDPGDVIGLPLKDESTGRTDFLPPYWFPDKGEPIVLFLDELNRARPEVLQTIMDLALNRKLAGRPLPEGSRIISAVNDGEEYQLTDLDPALVSRFNVYRFKPTNTEWLLWAQLHGVDSRILGFIQEESKWLDGSVEGENNCDTGLEKTPDRRAWKKVSDCLSGCQELQDIHKKLVAGIVGAGAAARFFNYLSSSKIIGAKEILCSYDRYKKTVLSYELHKQALVNESIFRYLELMKEDDEKKDTVCANLVAYLRGYENDRQKEPMAHFASLFENGSYQKAVAFIMLEVPEVYSIMADFLNTLF